MKIQVIQKIACCVGLVVALGGASAWGNTSDGTVIGATKIVDHGPDAQRYVIVLIGEGYQQSEQTKFAQDAQHFVDAFFDTPPFKTNCSTFNIWRIDVASTDSGADDPATCGDGSTGSGAMPKTYFDATFCGDGNIRRLLTSNNATAINVANAQVPNWDTAVVIVNSTQYGGSGGQIATTSISGSDWPSIAIHEYGHSAFALGDEYEYYAGCGVDAPGTHDNHPAVEPAAANLTVETNPALVKWHSLFYPGIAIPTTTNADCTKCDPQGDPFPGEQRVGLYEGADYFHCKASVISLPTSVRFADSACCKYSSPFNPRTVRRRAMPEVRTWRNAPARTRV
jgi:IgA Peptidase M64